MADILEGQAGAQRAYTMAEAATAAAEDRRLAGDADPEVWSAVADRWQGCKRPYAVAYARARQAEALMVAGDRATAETVLQEAESIAARLGARPLRAAIASLAARARLSLEAPGPDVAAAAPRRRPRPRTASPAASARCWRLVAQGRTNRQIADELFISENTAGVHVSNILGKLGVSGRTEAAAVAVRAGLVPEAEPA